MSIRTALLFFVCALAAPVFAQSITGTWQGTLPSGPSPRLVINVVKMADGSLHATLFRPDTWGLAGQPFSAVHVADGRADMAMELAGYSLTGTVSADGKTISGTWSENKQAAPLTLRLAGPGEYWIKAPTNRMDPHAVPSFEVVTIRPSAPDEKDFLFKPRNHLFRARNQTVLGLITFAYNLETRQVEGLPEWCSSERFDITGEADAPGDPVEDQTRIMLRKLLAERFGFKAHSTQKDLPVYALVVEKGPPKMTPATEMEGNQGRMWFAVTEGHGGMQAVATSMSDLAPMLMHFIPDRLVVDRTGLAGRWDFRFDMPLEVFQRQSEPGDREAAMFRGVESLGLKLQPMHTAVDLLVVDHIDKPSAN